MKFNKKKFQVLRYGKNEELKEDTVYFSAGMETVIDQVNSCKDLGIMMTDNAKFDDQIDQASGKARQKCGLILRTLYTRDPMFLRHMFNTLAQPHLDYCSQLWAPTEGTQLYKIEKVLKDYTKKIPNLK